MWWPLPYIVGHRVYQSGLEDAHGNPIPGWAAPVDVRAMWWSPATQEPLLAGHDREVVDVVVVVASTTTVGARDRMVVEGREFEIVGDPLDFDHGPHLPAGVRPVNLKRVTG